VFRRKTLSVWGNLQLGLLSKKGKPMISAKILPNLTNLSKLWMLLGLAVKHPVEFYDRASTILECQWERSQAPTCPSALNLTEAWHFMEQALGRSIQSLDREDALSEIETNVLRRLDGVRSKAPFSLDHSADITLARCCYLLWRTLEPAIVLETGVAYGKTSAFLLSALHRNSRGELWSIDLPPLGRDADRYVGALIPEPLRNRWHLHRGSTKRILHSLLEEIGGVDLFIHDSLHTYRSMFWEFQEVWPFLRPGGVFLVDDVGLNGAFRDFTARVKPAFSAVVREELYKDRLFGIVMKDGECQEGDSSRAGLGVGVVPQAQS
jgi:predicted O-methyltransferase YrrM